MGLRAEGLGLGLKAEGELGLKVVKFGLIYG